LFNVSSPVKESKCSRLCSIYCV